MLRLVALGKRFGEVAAVDALSLEVGAGELLSLLGPSGCGKTTTLRMIAGFETPTSGRVWIDERDVTALPPQRRGVGMVFQNYALFPHLDVRQNVAFGLEMRGVRGAEAQRRADAALERVDLAGYGARRVQELSGGQQQRVALARALAPEPPLLLLDEPLSNLDATLRERTRTELRLLLKQVGITSIFVTHDQEEAFALSDRVAVLSGGRLQQVGTPEQLYREPANSFVAGFVGQSNFLPARLLDGAHPEATVELPGGARWPATAPAGAVGAVRAMVRPEALRLRAAGPVVSASELPGRVLERRFAGAATRYRVATEHAGELLVSAAAEGDALDEGAAVLVSPAPWARVHLFPSGG